MKRYFLTACCDMERHDAIKALESVIGNHGFIVDFKRFSDISITLIVETEEHKVDALYSELESVLRLKTFAPLKSASSNECIVFLDVSFSKAKGDMEIEVPFVPG